jgi:hypothetical protein
MFDEKRSQGRPSSASRSAALISQAFSGPPDPQTRRRLNTPRCFACRLTLNRKPPHDGPGKRNRPSIFVGRDDIPARRHRFLAGGILEAEGAPVPILVSAAAVPLVLFQALGVARLDPAQAGEAAVTKQMPS